MQTEIIDSFNRHANYLEMQIRERYGLEQHQLLPIRGPIYECQGRIYKLTHKAKCSSEYLSGMIDYIKYLRNNGISVPNVIPSLTKMDIEIIKVDDSYFSIVAYEKARGSLPDVENWNATLFQNWGQVMGKIHYLTKQYQTHEHLKNIHWDAREVDNFDRIIPNDQEKMVENSTKLLTRIRQIPKDKDLYGFIHCDFHHKNFFVDKSNITLIDFDDARNNWFIADLATSLFYAMIWSPKSLDNDVTPQKFLYNFLSGYLRENHLDYKMLKYIHDFLKYEQLKIYVHFYRYFELNKPDTSTLNSFYQTKENIETETPVFNIDIDKIYSLLY